MSDGFDLFYVKGPSGWLSTPRTKDHYSKYVFSTHFSDAKSFGSEAEARAAYDSECHRGSFSILAARAVFTHVSPSAEGADNDVLGLMAACEARDIRKDLDKASKDRMEALELTQNANSAKPSSRRI